MNETAALIISICEAKWDAEKSDCSGFVKAVCGPLGISLTGLADNIYDEIQGDAWTSLENGAAAKEAADNGLFVIGALKGAMNQPAQDHGHVVVVVSGPLDPTHGKYPTAYWGSLGGVGAKNTPLNYAWNAASRDKVEYASIEPTAVARKPLTVSVKGSVLPDAEGYILDNRAYAWIRPIANALGAAIGTITSNSVMLTLDGDTEELNVTQTNGQSFVQLGDLREFAALTVNFDGVAMAVSIN